MRKTGLGKHFTILLAALLALHHLGIAQSTQTQECFERAGLRRPCKSAAVGETSKVRMRLRNKEEVNRYISKVEDPLSR